MDIKIDIQADFEAAGAIVPEHGWLFENKVSSSVQCRAMPT